MSGCADCVYCKEKGAKNIPSRESCMCYGKIRTLSIYDIADDIKRGQCRFRKEKAAEEKTLMFQF